MEERSNFISWKNLAESAQPLLEWMERQEHLVGSQKADEARRLLVKMYLASSPPPFVLPFFRVPNKEPPVIVKVEIPPNALQATITSQDKRTLIHVPVDLVSRRLNGDLKGFFQATYEPGNIIELGERVPDENW